MKSLAYYDASGRKVEADEAIDNNGHLKSGFSTRVPLEMRDAMRAGGSTDDAVRATQHHVKVQALALADADNKHSWRGGAVEGDHCILDGKPAVLVKDAKGELVAQPLSPLAAKDEEAIKNAAYDEYNREARDAWRNPVGPRR